MYGKIEDGSFFVAPSIIHVGGMTMANPSDGQLKSAGYLPVETSDPPVADGMRAVPHYTEQDGKIVQTWTLEAIRATKEEQTISLARAMAATATSLTDTVALSIPDLLPTWDELLSAGREVAAGVCLVHDGQTYRVVQAVTPLESQPPGGEGMLAIYRPIEREHTGTLSDPIPWVYGMDCVEGKYYSYNGKTYRVAEGGTMSPCVWPPDTPGLWQWEAVE